MPRSHKIIYLIYVVVWIVLAINPKYRDDWLLENVLVFIFFPFVVWMDSRHHYTALSVFLLLIFTSLHSLGSHFTYAEMKYFDGITQFFGFERNHFDRVVHFLFGLLAFRMLFEMITHNITTVRTALFFTLTTVISISTCYELAEWLSAEILHPELGMAFLGTQGDIWDAQKDTLLATIGGSLNFLFYRHYAMLHQNIIKDKE